MSSSWKVKPHSTLVGTFNDGFNKLHASYAIINGWEVIVRCFDRLTFVGIAYSQSEIAIQQGESFEKALRVSRWYATGFN